MASTVTLSGVDSGISPCFLRCPLQFCNARLRGLPVHPSYSLGPSLLLRPSLLTPPLFPRCSLPFGCNCPCCLCFVHDLIKVEKVEADRRAGIRWRKVSIAAVEGLYCCPTRSWIGRRRHDCEAHVALAQTSACLAELLVCFGKALCLCFLCFSILCGTVFSCMQRKALVLTFPSRSSSWVKL